MGALSPRQRSEYLETGGACCPACGSRSMASEIQEFDRLQGFIDVGVRCIKCNLEWIEVFTMTNVLDVDGRE